MNPISLQLWTLNENTGKDFAGTVAEVAKIGYKAVELAGTGNLTPKEAAQALDDVGLQVSGLHVGWDWFTQKYDELIENAKRFKTNELILPGIDPKKWDTKESCLAWGKELGAVGAKVRGAGMKLSYHNHDKEFILHDGRPALEWMLEASEPQDVAAQVDLFWVLAAAQDPLRAIHRLGTRARSLHLKDGIGRKQTDLGQGKVDFPAIFKFVEANHLAEWYIVEQEEFPGPRMESVRAAYTYLKSLGKS